MRQLVAFSFLLLQAGLGNLLLAQAKVNDFNKANLYAAMRGNNEADVNKQLSLIKTTDIAEKNAYEGALIMKLAGLVSGPKKKLDLFKDGHKKLEADLQKDSTNTEFRFLRLMIQEHAPGILGYKNEIPKDKLYIIHNFKKLSPVVQQAVTDYSKQSKILKPTDFVTIN